MRIALFLMLAMSEGLWTLRADEPANQIKAVLTQQAEAWNRGDIPAFVDTYADDCVFVGKKIVQGRGQLTERYRRVYPTPAAMGKLSFSSMVVHLLDKDVATVTADWHLERTSQGGGDTGGYFSLVLQRKRGEWKIELDHTSAN